ncbi:hypothetical protein WICANDRAFT_63783 [Wickerhamomyces anomalus NRRL Y-366-8]|uniref:Uncharacterized protein n=1 Tax=Wickerhamomyces anomalus (strain ATCC 58044 / CBS 1984 / NCYC 433 / NRRL Y-366-8) TaxID=683960 RepID=A0A1E3P323_WICAA|nr:uncharacterized protein WICANDRAFT_63783 [Wickerhamomyces anomalus NRRL Y-366-8]ODQ59287.1 hypothetical protein WICANDRAFT_63783 [Wickerhamomyces anomalus NRRL Y-366-8]
MLSLFKTPSSRLICHVSRNFKPFLISTRKASAISDRVIFPKQKLIKEQTEYKQLPDDSMYIEKFYDELDQFKKEIETNKSITQSNFSDFEKDPNELIQQLELFIEGKIKPQYVEKVMSKFQMERFDEFLRNVKITLILNGGHPMIFDILLQSKAQFDWFVKRKK